MSSLSMRKALVAAGALAIVAAAPVAAQTYDAYASFNASQGAGNFYYGQSPTTGTSFTLFAATTNCFIDGSICLQAADNHDVPGVTKSTATSFQYGSVNVPDDRLLLHPSSDTNPSQNLGVIFFTPTDGTYRVTATFSVQDVSPTGVNVNLLTDPLNALPYTLTPLGQLNAGNLTFSYTGTFNLSASDLVGFTFDNAGAYFNDSTGLKFTVTAVPEPATWGLMILGFGAVGATLRRRSTKVAYAA